MPEYTYNGESTYYATTCQECAAGCGLVIRTIQGRAIKAEGNPLHPVNQGKTCARGQATIQGLYNPDRVKFPVKQDRKPQPSDERVEWDQAINLVAEVLKDTPSEQVAFLLGTTHDHLADFVSNLFAQIGSDHLYRINATSMLAAEHSYPGQTFTYDIQNADLILSFGANFLETWESPVSYTRQYAVFRKGKKGRRGTLIHFEPRMSQTAAVADQWIPIIPGTEYYAAMALGRLIAEAQGQLPKEYDEVDPAAYAQNAGVDMEALAAIAGQFTQADAPLAIPGSLPAGQNNGLANTAAILSLNALAASAGKPDLVLTKPEAIIGTSTISSMNDIQTLTAALNSGEIKTVLIHGTNPVFEIPAVFGFKEALSKAETIISFSTFPDETALLADYIFPDHTSLESWGYQRVQTAVSGSTLSGSQPVVSPFFETRSTLDVFLAAIQQIGGELASALPFTDEVAYLENSLSDLLGEENTLIRAGDAKTFMAQFQQFGGWWVENQTEPAELELTTLKAAEVKTQLGEHEFYLHTFLHPILG
ncbi:MAG: molybdopterin-dependent oxidoreductase, partial [Anaerolineales bacterium]